MADFVKKVAINYCKKQKNVVKYTLYVYYQKFKIQEEENEFY